MPKKQRQKSGTSRVEDRAASLKRQKELAQEYLYSYHCSKLSDASNDHTWKFQKIRQIWILDNILDSKLIDKEHFVYAVQYLNGLQGGAKETLLDQLRAILIEYKACKQNKKDGTAIDEKTYKRLKKQNKRAKTIIKALA
jgi:hypothetical protein